MPRRLSIGLAFVLVLATASPALAVPPPNDNYLGSIGVATSDEEVRQTVDTTEATTQADLFDPNRDGLPFGGSGPEPLSCPVAPSYGRTVWYDLAPPTAGAVRIATSGFDNVIALYEWTRTTSQLGRLVACANATAGATEVMEQSLRSGRNYTVQLGGVGGAGGPLDVTFEYFQDTDGDEVLDGIPDECLRLRGIPAFGGCPPEARGAPGVTTQGVGSGARVLVLRVDRADKGTRIEVRCRRCGRAVRARARRAGTVRVRGFEGRILPAGDRLEVRLTHPRTGSGRYRFGAITKVFRFPVAGGRLGQSKKTCYRPGSRKTIRCRA